MHETVALAKFAVETNLTDIPTGLIEKAKVYVLDNLASGFVGSALPWSDMTAELARRLGGQPEASVFNRPWQADVSRAALVNGAMIGAFEVEHVGHSAHPGGTTFPAALATAEHNYLDGKAFLTAMILGYEITCRVGQAQTRATEDERGFHNPGVNGVFGSAIAVGKLMGLDEKHMAWAMGIAGSHAGGLTEFAWEGAMTKRLHLGRASQMGLESALLAEMGFTGPTTVLEGKYGYLNAVSPSPLPEKLLDGLGHVWICDELTIKAYPCHVTGQAIAHAIGDFKKRQAIEVGSIKSIAITGNQRLAEAKHLDSQPETILGGQYSIPFTVAVALARDLSNPAVFNEDALKDTEIRNLARKVHVTADATRFPDRDNSEISIETSGGTNAIEANGFPGSLEQPLDFQGAREKFRRYTSGMIGDERIKEIIGAVQDLESIADISELARLIRDV